MWEQELEPLVLPSSEQQSQRDQISDVGDPTRQPGGAEAPRLSRACPSFQRFCSSICCSERTIASSHPGRGVGALRDDVDHLMQVVARALRTAWRKLG